MRVTRSKWVGIAVGMVVLTVAVWFLVRPGSETRLPDGSVLSVEWISYGKTNVYVEGSLAERTLGSLLQRFNVNAFVRPPTREVFSDPEGVLSVRLRLRNIPRSPSYFGSHGHPRVAVADARTGHHYLGFIDGFRKSGKEQDMHTYVNMTAFPRRQRYLRFELHDGTWALVGQISAKNPAYQPTEPFSLAESPSTIALRDMELTFGPVEELPEEATPTDRTARAILNLKLSRDGLTVTNWRLSNFTFRDAYGNHGLFGGRADGVEWQRHQLRGSLLDMAHAWKAEFTVNQDADFSAEELCSFDVRDPLRERKIEVCRGRTLSVDFVGGAPTYLLAVTLLETNGNLSLTFVGATDQNGTPLTSEYRDWSQQYFVRELHGQSGANGGTFVESETKLVVRITVAIHTNYYPAEYVFTPNKMAQ